MGLTISMYNDINKTTVIKQNLPSDTNVKLIINNNNVHRPYFTMKKIVC